MSNPFQALRDLRANNRKIKNRDPLHATVAADSTGNYLDPILRPGKVYVSGNRITGWVNGPRTGLSVYPGLHVLIEYDEYDRYYISRVDGDAELNSGNDPNVTSVPQRQTVTQSQLETLRCVALGDLIVGVKGWPVIENGTGYQFPGATIDIGTAGAGSTSLVPGAGEMCYVVVFVMSDFSTLEAFASTPRDITDVPLNVDDWQECLDQATLGSTAVWAIALQDDQSEISQEDIDVYPSVDLRQVVNTYIAGESGYVVSTSTSTDNAVPRAVGESGEVIEFTNVSIDDNDNLSAVAFKATGTAGAGFVEILTQSSAPSAPATGNRLFSNSGGWLAFKNGADGFIRSFIGTLTANHAYTLQDGDGTLAFISDVTAALTGAVILAPGSSTRNVIQPSGDYKALVVRGNASQTAALQEWQNSSSTVLASVDATGLAVFAGINSTPIGATTPSTGAFTGITITTNGQIKPSADGLVAIQIANAAGTGQWFFDTTNGRFGNTNSPTALFDVFKAQNADTSILIRNSTNNTSARAGIEVRGAADSIFMLATAPTYTAVSAWQNAALFAASYTNFIFSAYGATGQILFQTGGLASGNVRAAIDATGNFGVGITSSIGAKLHVITTNTDTNVVANVAILGHGTSATPAAGFGTGLLFQGHTNPTSAGYRNMAYIEADAADSNDVTRRYNLKFGTYNVATKNPASIIIGYDGVVGIASAPTIGGALLQVVKAQNSVTSMFVYNATDNASAGASISIQTASTFGFSLAAYPPTFSVVSAWQNSSVIASSLDLIISSYVAAGQVKFQTGGTGSGNIWGVIDASGRFGWGITSSLLAKFHLVGSSTAQTMIILANGSVASAASATWNGIQESAATVTISGSTNITTATGFNFHSIAQPTLSAANAITITNAATLYIANAPTGGGAGPATITNPYALWVDAGASRFDGNIDLSNAAVNVILQTGTGTQWGTATGQKQAWWGATPVVQQVLATGAGATVDNVISLLQTLGLCKQS